MNKNNDARKVRGAESAQPKPPAPELPGAFGDLLPGLRRAIAKQGYSTPTPIQEQAIPHLLAGKDLLGCAQTGTGKTAAFLLPILNRLASKKRRLVSGSPSVLILAPTRELAAQIGQSIKLYGSGIKVDYVTVFGGVRQYHQVKALNRGVDILVATPGRLLDLKKQGYIKLKHVETFVLDEMDRMLDMGFLPGIKQMVSDLPADHQTILFSATLPSKMKAIAGRFLDNPVEISIEPKKPTVDGVSQKVLFVGKNNKENLLLSLLDNPDIDRALVFIQMKHSANRLVKRLKLAGIDADAFHGNKTQSARTATLDGFRRGKLRVLVATDVAARGLDVDQISHVINYDLPVEAETYVHRIGRTARAGAVGDAISFCSAEDRSALSGIEKLLGAKVAHDKDHEFHCEQAFRSTGKQFRKKGGRPPRGGGRFRSKGRPRFRAK